VSLRRAATIDALDMERHRQVLESIMDYAPQHRSQGE
jgi:hypothetical protein